MEIDFSMNMCYYNSLGIQIQTHTHVYSVQPENEI